MVHGGRSPVFGACLDGVARQTYANFDVIVVNNAPDQPIDAALERVSGRCRCVSNPSNVGFAPAVNQAWRMASGELIATLNDDAIPDPAWLERLVGAMVAHPEAGSCASKMLFYSCPAMINSAGIAVDRAGMMWDWRGGQMDHEAQDEALVEVFGACAGAALYRKAMLDDLDGFDEDYFAYLEDVDLAWRARLRGWRCLHVPSARVTHVFSSFAGANAPFKNRLLGRNKIWTILKNYPAPYLASHLPLILLYDALAVGYRLLHGDASALAGRLAALKAVGRFWHKRKLVQGASTPAAREATWALMARASGPVAVRRRYAHLAHLPPPSPTGAVSPASGQSESGE